MRVGSQQVRRWVGLLRHSDRTPQRAIAFAYAVAAQAIPLHPLLAIETRTPADRASPCSGDTSRAGAFTGLLTGLLRGFSRHRRGRQSSRNGYNLAQDRGGTDRWRTNSGATFSMRRQYERL